MKELNILQHGQLLCILTSFGVLRAPGSWLNCFFSALFNLFVQFKLKTAKKSSLTSFWVGAAPESWWNYFFQSFSIFFVRFNLKTAKKSSLTSFWVGAAPESWSNYFFQSLSIFLFDLIWKRLKKVVQPACGACSTQKLVKIHNSNSSHGGDSDWVDGFWFPF